MLDEHHENGETELHPAQCVYNRCWAGTERPFLTTADRGLINPNTAGKPIAWSDPERRDIALTMLQRMRTVPVEGSNTEVGGEEL